MRYEDMVIDDAMIADSKKSPEGIDKLIQETTLAVRGGKRIVYTEKGAIKEAFSGEIGLNNVRKLLNAAS